MGSAKVPLDDVELGQFAVSDCLIAVEPVDHFLGLFERKVASETSY